MMRSPKRTITSYPGLAAAAVQARLARLTAVSIAPPIREN
jgi:hypothetical protein